jgi:nucleoside-diphosphate-sugar epimerase
MSLVQDLAKAFIKVLGHPNATQQIFNVSGAKYVTFDGLARACAKVKDFRHPEIIRMNILIR